MNYKFADRMAYVQPSAIRDLLKLGASKDIIAFGGGYPDPSIFPIEKLQAVYQQVLEQDGALALQYSASRGIPSLLDKIAKRMEKNNAHVTADNIIMLHGGQQGLEFMSKLFINIGDVIIAENPTFIGKLVAAAPYQPRFVGVPMDEDGMNMEALENALKLNPVTKFIYTIPDFQNPTGITMSFEKRKRMVELANQYDVIIVEDSPYREIRYQGESLPSIKSFDTEGRVVFLGSFSKILSPGLRQAWAVASPEIIEKLDLMKMAADTQNSTINMLAVDKFMELYDMDEHIETIKNVYRKKKQVMIDTIQREFPRDISYTNPEGGLFIWLSMPKHIDSKKLMAEVVLPQAKVAYVPGEAFYAENPEQNHCRINYSYVSEEKIVEGMTRLGKILKELSKNHK